MKKKQDVLQRIARYLMLHSSFINNIGLLNGKMGIAIFFFHYAKYINNKLYEDFAGCLIDEIYAEININSPKDFKNGLCGIAWGMEYLIQNNFVQADADEVLEDLDKQILERDVRKISDISLETGLKGIAYYVISRCENRKKVNSSISKEYIIDLIASLSVNMGKDEESILLSKQLKHILNQEDVPYTNKLLYRISSQIKYKTRTIFEEDRPLGIENSGYTGIGIKILQENS